jgi:hypothetical protein
MDSLITAAARALAMGDPLGALNRVALRDDAPALALRGIAMAQLGDLNRAKALVRRAARAFGPREAVARARCAAVLAFLADGESWSGSALALALGASQRTVQRALKDLSATGKVQAFGRGRARRWMTPPLPGFATTLLLPPPLPGG